VGEAAVADDRKYGARLDLSEWHRTASLSRFIGRAEANDCAMIDVDCLEYCRRCKTPLALMEWAMLVGGAGQYKNTSVVEGLAVRASVPAFLVLYKLSPNDNPCTAQGVKDVEGFVVQKLYPLRGGREEKSPAEFARLIRDLHQACPSCERRAA
jgi:hypothetical protein